MTALGFRLGAALIAGAATIIPIAGAAAEGGRSIALVLDASGSMNAKLPDGVTRIEAAKAAVADLVGKLPGDTRLAFRVYGHQSPTQAKNCQDTQLLVGFGSVSTNKSAIVAAARGIRAQGYTPITYSLKLAAEDLAKEEAASRVVVLVSDGRETCAADPCATAKALADADAKLVVHTVGLGVDGAARYQLQCIANVARGIYVAADSTADLAAALSRTAEAAPVRKTTESLIGGDAKGKIRVAGAPPALHEVVDAATGKQVGTINTGSPSWVELPAGIYNVKFPNGLWMGVEVKAGVTTTLKPGILRMEGRDLWGNKLLDPETQEIVGEIGALNSIALLPTRVLVAFGNRHKARWPEPVEIREGETTTLRPGSIEVRSASSRNFTAVIRGTDGQFASEVFGWAIRRVALPPGRYTIDLDGQQISGPVELSQGQDVKITIP